MAGIKFPIVTLEDDKFQATVDLSLYTKDVITAAIYKFSHHFYIHQMTDIENPNFINVIFEPKEGKIVTKDIPNNFA